MPSFPPPNSQTHHSTGSRRLQTFQHRRVAEAGRLLSLLLFLGVAEGGGGEGESTARARAGSKKSRLGKRRMRS